MSSSFLPLEIIQLILSFLPQQNLSQLLVSPPTHDWLYATASVVYRRLIFTYTHQLTTCLHLFEQTRKRRRLGHRSFYSTINYALFVRQIDLSGLLQKDELSNTQLISLTMDCANLSQLNLYNCYTLTNVTMITILQQCPQLERLSLAGATSITASSFLNAKVLCPRLRTLNLNLLPNFFNITRHGSTTHHLPTFPKLQELKLGKTVDPVDWRPFTRMIQRCANVTRLLLDTLGPQPLKICLEHCSHINSITFHRCYFHKGMLTRLLSSPQSPQRKLKRLDINHCFAATGKMEHLVQELMVGDYSRLKSFGCRRMRLDSHLLALTSTATLTRMDCPESMTDGTLSFLMSQSPALTHLSVYKSNQLEWKTLKKALTVWQKTLVWLELSGGNEPDAIIDYLCTWSNHVEVLLLDEMTLGLGALKQLSGYFTETRYFAFRAALTDYNIVALEHVLRSWKCLEGIFCVNQDELMAENQDTWLDWKWMDSRRDQFTRWKGEDFIS